MIAIPPEAIKSSLLEFLVEFWKIDHDEALTLALRPLKAKADEVMAEILRSAIEVHSLYPIIKYVLQDIVDHSVAIDIIGKNRATLLHVRHIEELYTVTKYLLATSDRYEEFAWRWNNFQTIHAIRNRILNLKQPLDPLMVEWLNSNIEMLKRLFSKKFDRDPEKCLDQWEKVANWFYKIPLNEIFKNVGRLTSYTSATYDWNSQSVHLSPLGNQYMGYELRHQDYGDIAIDSAKTYLYKMCHECSLVVTDQDGLRKYYLRQVLLETYEMLCNRPTQYLDLANKGGQYAALTELLLRKPFDFSAVMSTSLSPPPKDPLLFDFAATGVK